MSSHPFRARITTRPSPLSHLLLASLGLALAFLSLGMSTQAQATPVLDGNINDVIAQAQADIANGTGCGVIINDAAKDICLTDPAIVPCTSTFSACNFGASYYVNGFDQTLAVAAVSGTDAWWGIRTAGQIGDADGDGTDDKGTGCPAPGGGNPVTDVAGIGPGESYVIQLDTNCDNVTDIRITVSGGAGTKRPAVIITDGVGIPIAGASGTSQYGTTDLEIHTTGLSLPPVFSMSTFLGSQSDGMSEDGAGPVKCNAPAVSLLIQKTVDKPSICPGDKARFTVSVTNPSLVDLSTNVRDILPQGWTYANNVSGDFAFNSQNGQVVSFGPLLIPAGATRTVSFDATSPSACLGPYENKAVADGSFSSPCLPPPGVDSALTDTARASVSCQAKPCVTNVHCSAPDAACSGEQITVRGFATNCSNRPADIVITLNGHDHIINNVPAGGEAEFDTTFQFTCTPGQPTQFSISAVAKNSCGTSAPGNSTCQTACGTPPCVNNVHCTAPETVCSGDQVTLKGLATNCGDRTEEIVITLSGPGGAIGSHAFNVAAGAQAEFDTTVTLNCTPGAGATFTASGTGRNNCGVTQPVTGNGCTIQCKTPPCATVTCAAPAEASSGDNIQISAIGHNCGDRNEDLLVCVLKNGAQVGCHWLFNVPPNTDAHWDTTVTFHCTGSEIVNFSATVSAVNDCGQSTTVSSPTTCPVACREQAPCAVTTTIKSNFNGTSIVGVGNGPAYIWFNSNFTVKGTITPGTQIFLRKSVVVINGTSYNVPDATITFQSVSCASTSFDPLTKSWNTTVPLAGSDEIFLSGLVLPLLSLPGGATVSWSGTIESGTPGLCISWKWGAAVYKSWPLVGGDPFAVDYNAAQIKPTHSAACNINNGDHAGTPQNPAVRSSVTGGARGGGGSNFTGSWSGTASACLECPTQSVSYKRGGGSRELQVTGAGTAASLFEVHDAIPNPFTDNTTIAYAVGVSGERVTIAIFDVAGRLVRPLVDGVQPAGIHEVSWDGRDQEGVRVARGIYFLRAIVGGQRMEASPRILLLK